MTNAKADNKTAKTLNNIADLKFEDIKLIKAAGSAMLGIIESRGEGELKFKGINCVEMPREEEFTKLFTALIVDEADGITIDNPQNTTTLDMKAPQRLAFAGAHAKFVVALSMRDNQLTKMALKQLL